MTHVARPSRSAAGPATSVAGAAELKEMADGKVPARLRIKTDATGLGALAAEAVAAVPVGVRPPATLTFATPWSWRWVDYTNII